EAAPKFATAASMAVAVEAPFAESLFPRRAGVPAVEQMGVLAGALALAAPDPSHIDRLEGLLGKPGYLPERVIVTVALARCLAEAGRQDEALKVLHATNNTLFSDQEQSSMRITLLRELAKYDQHADSESLRSLSEY